ncbi:MAG: outer membrane protein TolC [Myxococcota bacterium]|jgi:outer membrane protein TolC
MSRRLTICGSLSWPTTFCSSMSIAGFLLIGVASAEGVTSEVEIISRYLSSPVMETQQTALQAGARAAGVLPPLLPNPELEVRREEARGPAGATTEALGGALTVDLGFSALPARSAARLRGEASMHQRHAQTLAGVCTVREDVLSLWAAWEQVAVTGATVARLEGVLSLLTALADAGDGSGYARDRAALALASHRLAAAMAQGERATQAARLSALTGQAVTAAHLAPLPPLPPLSESLERSTSHPWLLAIQLEEDAAGQATTAARRSVVPDLRISGGARWDAPPGGGQATQGYEIGAAVSLPVFDVARTERRVAAADEATAISARAEADAMLQATVEGAWGRASALESSPAPLDADRIWESARARYLGGESPIDELLQVAGELSDAQLSGVESTHLHRRARLDLSCAVGRFDEPAIQAALEESLR